MPVKIDEWVKLIDEEYLRDFVLRGGAAVKFVVGTDAQLLKLDASFRQLATDRGMVFGSIDSAYARLHMIQDIFFALSRQLNWEDDAQRFVERLFERNGYSWPCRGMAVALKEVAEKNDVDVTILRREVVSWLTRDIMRDPRLAQDFRLAVTGMCQNRFSPSSNIDDVVAPTLAWLRGDLAVAGFVWTEIRRG